MGLRNVGGSCEIGRGSSKAERGPLIVPAEWQTGVCEQLLRRQIARSAVDVTVIDRQNYHLFQPLLYQVATAVLSPGDITEPIPGRPAVSTKRHSAPRRGDRYHGAPSRAVLGPAILRGDRASDWISPVTRRAVSSCSFATVMAA